MNWPIDVASDADAWITMASRITTIAMYTMITAPACDSLGTTRVTKLISGSSANDSSHARKNSSRMSPNA